MMEGNQKGRATPAAHGAHLLLESWFSRVEEKLWFFLPNFMTLNASSELLT